MGDESSTDHNKGASVIMMLQQSLWKLQGVLE